MQLLDAAELVVSELVTNALVHAGTPVSLRIVAEPTALRVEVHDGSSHLPVRRRWADTAGTGRGLLIVEDYCDRWGSTPTLAGKVVWFEIGHLPDRADPTLPSPTDDEVVVPVRLLAVPLLMQWAWQEHASSLLREFLLYALEDDASALAQHAAASAALSLLHEQLPVPYLPTAPDVLMASLIEPDVTAPEVCLQIPASSVRHFEVLDDLLSRAVAAAREGRLLGAPTQPEIVEMRGWLCGEVARQAQRLEPVSWVAGTHLHVPGKVPAGWQGLQRELRDSPLAVVATDDSGIIVAVSGPALELMGYGETTDLVGRRVLVLIPERYHQAHIAGTTLHATNGRDALLGQEVRVPMVRSDGVEISVDMRVESGRHGTGPAFFAAHLRVVGSTPEGVEP